MWQIWDKKRDDLNFKMHPEREDILFIKIIFQDVPGSPVVKTSLSNSEGAGSISGQWTKIPHALAKKTKHKTEFL